MAGVARATCVVGVAGVVVVVAVVVLVVAAVKAVDARLFRAFVYHFWPALSLYAQTCLFSWAQLVLVLHTLAASGRLRLISNLSVCLQVCMLCCAVCDT